MEKLLFLGDFLYNYEEINEDIEEISKWIKRNGYKVILNLEAPLKSNKALPKWINLYNTEVVFEVLKKLQVIAVNLSNNHILDWSEEGLENLIKKLKQHNILYFGAGRNIEEAKKPLIIEYNGKKIGLVSYGWKVEMCEQAEKNKAGVNPLEEELIITQCKELKEKVDILIVNFHWGYEYEIYPLPVHRKLSHKLIDENLVDCIIGHHAHVIQAKEIYNKVNIYYGLGNFYFGSRRKNFENRGIKEWHKMSRYGLGIGFNKELKPTEVYFKYYLSEDKTKIFKKYDVFDISNIKLENYNSYFKKNRTSRRRPSLYIYNNFEKEISIFKLKKCSLKEEILKNVIKMLKKIKLYSLLKKLKK